MHTITRTLLGLTIALVSASSMSATCEALAVPAANSAGKSAAQPATTAESNKRTMERFTREFLPSGDQKLGEQFISPDIVLHFAGQQMRGRDTYLGIVAANQAAFPDLVWTVDHMVAEGDTVAIRYIMTGTHRGNFAGVPGSSKPVVAESMAFYRLAGGKIVEERAHLDMLSVFKQIGTVPGAK